MSDQPNPPENVIKGPWPAKSGREVKGLDVDVLATQQNIMFAEELCQSLMVQMIHTMNENGIKVDANDFIRDMAMIIELVKGTIYRDMGLKHPTQKFMEDFVEIVNSTPDEIETEVDFETIAVLTNLLEDDDGPELA